MMIKLLLAAGLAVATTAVHAQTNVPSRGDRPAWYLGAGVGYTSVDQSISDTSVPVAGSTSDSVQIRDTNTAGRGFVGFQVNRHFAIEGGYLHSGPHKVTRTVFEPTALAGTYDLRWNIQGFHLDALGILPVTEGFKLIGKVGLMRVTTKATFNSPGFSDSRDSSKLAFRYGAALQFDLTDRVAFRADADVMKKATNSNTVSIDNEEFTYKSFTANLLYKF